MIRLVSPPWIVDPALTTPDVHHYCIPEDRRIAHDESLVGGCADCVLDHDRVDFYDSGLQ